MKTQALKLSMAGAIVLVGSAIGGRAYASWRASASGGGQARVGTMSITVLKAEASESGVPLVPGGSGDLVVKVYNPNTFPVLVQSVSVGSDVTILGDQQTCATSVTFAQGDTPRSFAFPPGTSLEPGMTRVLVANGFVHLDKDAPSACQGTTFKVSATVTVKTKATP